MKKNSPNLIFIVDDDPDDRQIILDAFLEHISDIDYLFIESGEELMKSLDDEESDFPCLILLDLNMPGMMGLQALREIRATKKFSHIPIIILTTSTLDGDRKAAYQLGANCFLSKPDSFPELVEAADAILKLWVTFRR